MFGPARSASLLAGSLSLVFGVTVTACSNGSSPEQVRRQLADDLVTETDGALDDAAATCVADGLYQAYGDRSFQAVLDAADRPAGSREDVRTRVIGIFAGCDAIGALIDPGS